MLTLDPTRLRDLVLPLSTTWLLADCMEARGKQDLWRRQKPQLLAALRELAVIQSVESSNRIEGVTVSAERLRPLVLRGARPRDRSEEELAGYRRALQWIFTRKRPVEITPAIVLHLHALAQHGAPDAGKLKARDNEIIEILPSGGRRVRFRPTPPADTPAALRTLCTNFARVTADGLLPPLLALATFVFDLLCIHPFRDGNGRVARLATVLLLRQNGFDVPRFVSIERLIEERKEEYYATLAACSVGWHESRNEITPWWNFLLAVIRAAYRLFEQQITSSAARPSRSHLIRQAVLARPDSFTLAELAAEFPSASPQLIRKVLAGMKAEGLVRLEGRGRGAIWRVRH